MSETGMRLQGRGVALLGFAHEQAAELRGTLEREGAFCRALSRDAVAPLLSALKSFDAVVLKVGGDAGSPAIARAVVESCGRPVLVVGSERGVRAYLAKLRGPARAHSIEPCPDEDLVTWLTGFPATSSSRVSTSAPCVVIADGNPIASSLLEATLSRHRIACHVAVEGDEALALVKQFRPQVMILDVNMPGRDGFQVLEALRGDAQIAGTRVLVLTGRAAESDVRRGRTLGADAYVLKPFKAADVAERVRTLLAGAEGFPA